MGRVLVAVYGSKILDQICKKIRDNAYRKVVKNHEVIFIDGLDKNIKDVYKEAVRKASLENFGYVLIVNQLIKPIGDWVEDFIVSGKAKDYSFIYDSPDLYFLLINVRLVRKYGEYKANASNKVLCAWLKNKSISEGHNYMILDPEDLVEIIDYKAEIEKKKKSDKPKRKDAEEYSQEDDINVDELDDNGE